MRPQHKSASHPVAEFQINNNDPVQDSKQDVLGHGQEVGDGGAPGRVEGPREDTCLEAPAA